MMLQFFSSKYEIVIASKITHANYFFDELLIWLSFRYCVTRVDLYHTLEAKYDSEYNR